MDGGNSVRPGQSVLVPGRMSFQNCNRHLLPSDELAKRTGSLAMFFRKVYNLAHLRIADLCKSLQIQVELKRKIWTTFEYVLKSQTDMMKDRHLDQMIMCSMFITCKV